MNTASDVTRFQSPDTVSLEEVDFGIQKQHFPVGFDKNKIHHDFKHVWNYRLGK